MNEWVEVINLLCEKLGIAVDSASSVAEQLVPQLVKMELVTYTVALVVALLITIGCVIGIVKIWKYMQSEDYDDICHEPPCIIGMIALVVVGFISFLIGLDYLYEVIEWAIAPDVKVLKYISNMMK